MCFKKLLQWILNKKDKPMIRAQVSDQSPYSHFSVTGNGKLDACIVAVSDGGWKHPKEKVDPLIPADLKLLGLYHYLRSYEPIQEQIKTFDEAIQNWDWDFLAVDFEKIGNQHLDGKFAEMAKTFIDFFVNKYGARVLLYTRSDIIQEWILPFGQTWYQDCDLWIAQWPYNEKLYGPQPILLEVPELPEKWNPRLPAGSTDWAFWQYSSEGNKRAAEFGATGNSNLDLCVFNGTLEQMLAWAKKVPTPEPQDPPPAGDCEDQIADAEAVVASEYEKKLEHLAAVHETDLSELKKAHALTLSVSIKKANNDALQSLIAPLLK